MTTSKLALAFALARVRNMFTYKMPLCQQDAAGNYIELVMNKLAKLPDGDAEQVRAMADEFENMYRVGV